MQAVILAAGRGTRMGELTKDKPKPLLEAGNRVLLQHTFDSLPSSISRIIVVVGYLEDKIQKYGFVKKNSITSEMVPIEFVKQHQLKGTAHALFSCVDKLIKGEKFLVLMGDDIYHREDLERLVKEELGVLVWRLKQDDKGDEKQAIVKTESGKVIDIIESQHGKKGDLVNTGAYVLDDRIFQYNFVPAGNQTNEVGLPQTFLQMIDKGAEFTAVEAVLWHKITTPEDLKGWI